MKDHFTMFAAYNAWANRLVYAAAAGLSPEQLEQRTGAFFGSVIHTLNHLLVADRVWLHRLTAEGEQPRALDEILHADLADLAGAREREDQRLIRFVEGLTEERIAGTFSYAMVSKPDRVNQKLGSALAHVFNHQTHHRGQVHGILTTLGQPSLTLDLVYFQRGEGRQWL